MAKTVIYVQEDYEETVAVARAERKEHVSRGCFSNIHTKHISRVDPSSVLGALKRCKNKIEFSNLSALYSNDDFLGGPLPK